MTGINGEEQLKAIAEKLEMWCRTNCREYPWRKSDDPYTILVTEFLLQRTRSDIVLRVFNDFFLKFGTIDKLASAKKEELYSFFNKVGLLYRAERLLETAKNVVEKYGGKIPCDFDELLSLNGVGVYMASAVLNFGCNKPTPVVDKNVMRVMNRVFNVTSEREAREIIVGLYRYGDHKLVAYALIDVGALICLEPPRCVVCPLNGVCAKYPLRKNEWRMLRKAIRGGRIGIGEQPVK